MKKIMVAKKYVGRGFSVLFALFMCWTVWIALARIQTHYTSPRFFIAALLCVTAVVVLCNRSKRFGRMKTLGRRLGKISPERLYVFSAVVLLALQIFLLLKLKYRPNHDSMYVDIAAKNFARDGNFENITMGLKAKKRFYFSRFPNNWAWLLILSGIHRVDYLLTGKVHDQVTPAISVLSIQLSLLLTFLTARHMTANKNYRRMAAQLPLLVPAFYLYAPIYYTDTVSMPFAALSMYAFVRFIKAERKRQKVIFGIVCFISVGLGYVIKGNLCILAVAFALYMMFEKGILKGVATGVVLALAIVLFSKATTAAGLAAGITTRELYEAKRLPPHHWVMMSLVGDGRFNMQEYHRSIIHGNYESKKKADMKRIKEDMDNYTPRTFVEHLRLKSSVTWSEGHYYALHHIKDSRNKRLVGFLKGDTAKRVFDMAQAVLLLTMLLSFVGGVFSKYPDKVFLLRMSVFGLAVFLLIWETRSRYLVNFLPFMVLICADGIRRTEMFFRMAARKFARKK